MKNTLLKTKDFSKWAQEISKKYQAYQIKASIKVNTEMLQFYYELGKEISMTSFKAEYGNNFYDKLSNELVANLPNVTGLSPVNIRYMERFYTLYNGVDKIFPQFVEQLFMIPWGHHRLIIDKCKDVNEAIFFRKL